MTAPNNKLFEALQDVLAAYDAQATTITDLRARCETMENAVHNFLKRHYAGEDAFIELQDLIQALTGKRPMAHLDNAQIVSMLDVTKDALRAKEPQQ